MELIKKRKILQIFSNRSLNFCHNSFFFQKIVNLFFMKKILGQFSFQTPTQIHQNFLIWVILP